MIGYILVNTRSNMEKITYMKLKGLKETQEIYPLFGEYDLILRVEARNFEELGTFVIKKVRSLPGVLDTKTLPAVQMK
ncbi:MAG: Lrp/AsnC ligand binding domain-containing protein [Candidatus Thermoplasmatota archaeon]|nr:Lrp/AsnC ligand binding domain-containing protein [Candidatus Thermoplasmatota archaeon]